MCASQTLYDFHCSALVSGFAGSRLLLKQIQPNKTRFTMHQTEQTDIEKYVKIKAMIFPNDIPATLRRLPGAKMNAVCSAIWRVQ